MPSIVHYLAICWMCLQSIPFAMAQSVTIFTDSQTQLLNLPPSVVVVQLDASQRIEETMSADLPANPQEAERLMRARMQSGEWETMEAELQRNAEGLAKAKALGVTKIPAIVIDDRYVVYGVSDVSRAIEMIETAGGSHDAD